MWPCSSHPKLAIWAIEFGVVGVIVFGLLKQHVWTVAGLAAQGVGPMSLRRDDL